jgi:hypothetical protein
MCGEKERETERDRVREIAEGAPGFEDCPRYVLRAPLQSSVKIWFI